MAYEKKDNTGALFVNDRKQSANHPDRQGTIMVDGREYWINGWLKKTQDGTPWLSLAVKPKDAPSRGSAAGARKPNKQEDEFGDAPF